MPSAAAPLRPCGAFLVLMCKRMQFPLHDKLLKHSLSTKCLWTSTCEESNNRANPNLCADTHTLASRHHGPLPGPLSGQFASSQNDSRIVEFRTFFGSSDQGRVQMVAFPMLRNAEGLSGFKARTRRELCRLAECAIMLAVALFLAPLDARADAFDFTNLTGIVAGVPGTYGGGPTQNPSPYPADFSAFSANGFRFTGIYACTYVQCFIVSFGSNCVGRDLWIVGN